MMHKRESGSRTPGGHSPAMAVHFPSDDARLNLDGRLFLGHLSVPDDDSRMKLAHAPRPLIPPV